MTTLREAAQQAIADICAARLCEVNSMSGHQEMLRLMIRATDTLRAALEQPEQEPVAWRVGKSYWTSYDEIPARLLPPMSNPQPLYTHPPRREWQGLTEEEIRALWASHDKTGEQITRAIEAALKEKNYG